MKYQHWYDWETSEENLNLRDAMDEVESLRQEVASEQEANREEFEDIKSDLEDANDRLSEIWIHLDKINDVSGDDVGLTLDTSVSVNGFSVDIDVNVDVALDTVATKLGVDHAFHKAHDLASR